MRGTLDMWDQQLAEAGAELTGRRAEYVEKLAVAAQDIYQDLAGGREQFGVRYQPCVRGGEQVQAQLDIMLARLEQHYGVRPILYATQSAYARYLADYDGYDIWIRNVFTRPQLGARRWAFWQYTDRARLQGYDGEERFIDMNVFNGSRAEFEVYGLK